MTTWGSQVGPLRGFMGNGITAEPPLPQFNPLRLQGNGIIQVDAPRNDPPVGGSQRNDRPIGPFAVTLSPITLENGSTLALATGNEAQVFDYAALVKWGRGGTNMVALIDWPVNGGTFVVDGDSLYVDAWALLPISGTFSADFRSQGLRVRLGAHATPITGPHGGATMIPRRTMYLPTPIAAGGGTSGDIFVPPFARRIAFQCNTRLDVNMGFDVLFRRFSTTFAQMFFGGTLGGAVLAPWLYVPRDLPTTTQTVVVNNNSGGALALTGGALVFDLDLGGG